MTLLLFACVRGPPAPPEVTHAELPEGVLYVRASLFEEDWRLRPELARQRYQGREVIVAGALKTHAMGIEGYPVLWFEEGPSATFTDPTEGQRLDGLTPGQPIEVIGEAQSYAGLRHARLY